MLVSSMSAWPVRRCTAIALAARAQTEHHPRRIEQPDREYALAKSQWSFKTAVELSAALAARKVSAVELAEDAMRRSMPSVSAISSGALPPPAPPMLNSHAA
jgi:hypothetical protein